MTKEASKDCFNEARNKPKLLIIGHARHGKDTFADLVIAQMGLSFISSSEFVGRRCVWHIWGEERYASFQDCFDDRVNFRSTWFNLITAYNTPDLARTGREMMEEHDVYVGMRNPDEFHACVDEDMFDYVIWVDGSQRHPPESNTSNGMTREMADIWIDNNGPEENLQVAVDNLQKRLHEKGYDVNGKMEMYTLEEVEPGLYSKEMEKPWHEDPCDPPTQKPLILPASADTPKELQVGYIPALDKATMTDESDLLAAQNKMVNPTFEESRKFHNDALMATCPDPTPVPIGTHGRYNGGHSPSKPSFVSNAVPQSTSGEHDLTWTEMPEGSTPVLDQGFFRVLEVMGSDKTICESARMSYGRGTKKTSNDASLINYLVRNKHTSPLEMGEIRFHIRMPIFVMRQWVRHRTANLNEYSGRYSEMVRLFYIPELEQICLQDKVNKQGSAQPMAGQNAMSVVDDMFEVCDSAFDMYEDLLKRGVSRETARIILPLNTYTEVVWKLDISNLIKFLWLRDDDHAQWEIQQYAKLVSKAVATHFPLVFAAYTESRASQSFSEAEIAGLITGDCSHISHSQAGRIHDLRENAELFVS